MPSSPPIRLKSELPSTQQQQQQKRSLTHQKTLSPNHLSGRSPFRLSYKSSSVDIHDKTQQPHPNPTNNRNATPNTNNNNSHSVWHHQTDTEPKRSNTDSSDSNGRHGNEQVLPGSCASSNSGNTPSISNSAPSKKIKRLIYEIGNLLSFVGISKDLSQLKAHPQTTPSVSRTASPQPSASGTTPSSIHVISPEDASQANNMRGIYDRQQPMQAANSLNTRRSQFKKQTPSTIISSCSNHDMSELLETNLDRNNPDFKQYRSKHRN